MKLDQQWVQNFVCPDAFCVSVPMRLGLSFVYIIFNDNYENLSRGCLSEDEAWADAKAIAKAEEGRSIRRARLGRLKQLEHERRKEPTR